MVIRYGGLNSLASPNLGPGTSTSSSSTSEPVPAPAPIAPAPKLPTGSLSSPTARPLPNKTGVPVISRPSGLGGGSFFGAGLVNPSALPNLAPKSTYDLQQLTDPNQLPNLQPKQVTPEELGGGSFGTGLGQVPQEQEAQALTDEETAAVGEVRTEARPPIVHTSASIDASIFEKSIIPWVASSDGMPAGIPEEIAPHVVTQFLQGDGSAGVYYNMYIPEQVAAQLNAAASSGADVIQLGELLNGFLNDYMQDISFPELFGEMYTYAESSEVMDQGQIDALLRVVLEAGTFGPTTTSMGPGTQIENAMLLGFFQDEADLLGGLGLGALYSQGENGLFPGGFSPTGFRAQLTGAKTMLPTAGARAFEDIKNDAFTTNFDEIFTDPKLNPEYGAYDPRAGTPSPEEIQAGYDRHTALRDYLGVKQRGTNLEDYLGKGPVVQGPGGTPDVYLDLGDKVDPSTGFGKDFFDAITLPDVPERWQPPPTVGADTPGPNVSASLQEKASQLYQDGLTALQDQAMQTQQFAQRALVDQLGRSGQGFSGLLGTQTAAIAQGVQEQFNTGLRELQKEERVAQQQAAQMAFQERQLQEHIRQFDKGYELDREQVDQVWEQMTQSYRMKQLDQQFQLALAQAQIEGNTDAQRQLLELQSQLALSYTMALDEMAPDALEAFILSSGGGILTGLINGLLGALA